MPAGLFSKVSLPSAGHLPETSEEQGAALTSLPWQPQSAPILSRSSRSTLFFGGDAEIKPSSVKGRSLRTAFGHANAGSKLASQTAKVESGNIEKINAKKLEFRMRDGKPVFLCPDSMKCCQDDCKRKAMPQETDISQSSVGGAQVEKLEESRKNELSDCEIFCEMEFFKPLCFPGDSTVVVRDRGRVALEDLRLGDAVLSFHSSSNGEGWELCFQEVLAFLHHEPDSKEEFLRIRHELGQVHLSANHLIFAQSETEGTIHHAAPIFAKQVRIGDHVLAPWIDGSLTASKVLEVEVVRKQGIYAPLVETGVLLVDGTAASCYAIPDNLSESAIYKTLSKVASADSLQAAYHTLLLPLRIASKLSPVASRKALPGSDASTPVAQPQGAGPIHPYAWALYVTASSLVA